MLAKTIDDSVSIKNIITNALNSIREAITNKEYKETEEKIDNWQELDIEVLARHVAINCYDKEKYDASLLYCEEIIKKTGDIDWQETYVNLGWIYAELNLIEKEEALCRTILEHDSEYANIHWNLAQILQEQEKFEEAKEHYTKCLSIMQKAKDPQLELKILETKKALKELGGIYLKLGHAVFDENRMQEALDYYKKAIALNTNYKKNQKIQTNKEKAEKKIFIKEEIKDLQLKLKILETKEAVKKSPVEKLKDEGNDALNAESYEKAFQAYTKALTLEPENNSIRLLQTYAIRKCDLFIDERLRIAVDNINRLNNYTNQKATDQEDCEFYCSIYYEVGMFYLWREQNTCDSNTLMGYSMSEESLMKAKNLNGKSEKVLFALGLQFMLRGKIYLSAVKDQSAKKIVDSEMYFIKLYQNAKSNFEQLIEIFAGYDKENNYVEIAETYGLMAEVCEELVEWNSKISESEKKELLESALQNYELAFKSNPFDYQKSRVKVGDICLKLGKYQEAQKIYQDILDNPEFDFNVCSKVRLLYNIGLAKQNQDMFHEGMRDILLSLQKNRESIAMDMMEADIILTHYSDEIEQGKLLSTLSKPALIKTPMNLFIYGDVKGKACLTQSSNQLLKLMTEKGITFPFKNSETSVSFVCSEIYQHIILENAHDFNENSELIPIGLNDILKNTKFNLKAFVDENLNNDKVMKGFFLWMEQDLNFKEKGYSALVEKFECLPESYYQKCNITLLEGVIDAYTKGKYKNREIALRLCHLILKIDSQNEKIMEKTQKLEQICFMKENDLGILLRNIGFYQRKIPNNHEELCASNSVADDSIVNGW